MKNNLRKRVLAIICISTLIVLNQIMAFGAEEEKLAQAPDVNTAEHAQEIQELKNNIIAYNERFSEPKIGGSKYLNVPLFKQINDYYCGPTSARMTLKYLGVDKTQSQLAGDLGTTSGNGTYVYAIRNCLNNYLGSGAYKYVLTSEIAFNTGLQYSIDKGKPVVCHVMTGVLPNYANNGGHNTGHYVVASGYLWGAQGGSGASKVRYNDPNNNSKYYGTWDATWGEMSQAINNNAGYYIMAN